MAGNRRSEPYTHNHQLIPRPLCIESVHPVFPEPQGFETPEHLEFEQATVLQHMEGNRFTPRHTLHDRVFDDVSRNPRAVFTSPGLSP